MNNNPNNNSGGSVWDKINTAPNNNYNDAQNLQSAYRAMYQNQKSQNCYYVNGDNMAPETYNVCFVDTTTTNNLNKWIRVFKISCIVLFVLLIIYGIVDGYNTANVEKIVAISAPPYYATVKSFDTAVFIGYIFGYGIAMFAYFVIYQLVYALLNCIAQITRNTGISAKLAAFNTRNQMMNEVNKNKDNQAQN